MSEAPNNGGNEGGAPTASQIGAGVTPDTGADSAALQGAAPADDATDDVGRIAAKEKRAGKRAGQSEVLEALGFDNLEAATQWVGEYRSIEQEMESEAERANKARERAEAERETYRTRYETTERRYALRDALRDAGVPGDRLNDALALANLEDISLDKKTGEVSGVEEVVEALITPRPWLLETEQQAQRVSAPQTRTTTAQRPTDEQQSSGDVNTDMGRGMLDWLTHPVEQEQAWP